MSSSGEIGEHNADWRTEVHYAIRYTSQAGQHLIDYGTDKAAVVANLSASTGAGVYRTTVELLYRKVTYQVWQPMIVPPKGT